MAKKKSAGAKYFGKPVTDDPDDAPELLNDFFRHGELRRGDQLIRRGRPPLSGKTKTAITLRLDEDVVKSYRETGEGWQTRINADLRRARKLNVRAATTTRSAKRGPVTSRSKAPQMKRWGRSFFENLLTYYIAKPVKRVYLACCDLLDAAYSRAPFGS